MLKISRFAHFLGEKNLWHALNFVLFREPDCIMKILGAGCRKIRSEFEWRKLLGKHFELLIDSGFLATEEQDDSLLKKVITETSSRMIQGLYLMISNRCNLTCSYCLYGVNGNLAANQGALNQSKDMPEQIAEAAIEYFTDIVKQNVRLEGYWEQITFYGGEPLLNINALKASIMKIRKLKGDGLLWDTAALVVNTNGTLIDGEIIDLLKYGNVEVQLSIDGFQDVHDKNRYTLIDGKCKMGSFDLAVRALKKLVGANILVTPMITVTEDNLLVLDEFVVWLCREFGIRSYGMNILMSGTGVVTENYPEKAARKMLETHQITTTYYSAYDVVFQKQIDGLLGPKVAKQECGTGRKLVVFPDGTLHTCQALAATGLTLIGQLPNLWGTESNWKNWNQRTRFQNKSCLECPALGGCAGGCAGGSFYTSCDINAVDINKCKWTKFLFDSEMSKYI